ncbi:hypothetical protein [Actinoplanes sp. NPDC026623]|uniref:hypothetical protein n=1 Tax=Actinoplanes sp. NPDC026623 TaxID=3155610 RepID=UPI0033D5A7B9
MDEQNYCYGVGSLTLRVTAIHRVWQHDDGLWVEVDGIPLWRNGYEGMERYALIRVGGIRRPPCPANAGTTP